MRLDGRQGYRRNFPDTWPQIPVDPNNLDQQIKKTRLRNRALNQQAWLMYKQEPNSEIVPDDAEVTYKNRRFPFKPSVYLSDPKQFWKLDAIIDSARMQALLATHPIVDIDFIETLLGDLSFFMYLSDDQKYLIAADNEVMRANFGCLTKISLLEAARCYGISAVEEAGEKTFARL